MLFITNVRKNRLYTATPAGVIPSTKSGFMEFVTINTRWGIKLNTNTTVIMNSISVTCFVRRLGPAQPDFSLLADDLRFWSCLKSRLGVDSRDESCPPFLSGLGEFDLDFILTTFFSKSPYGSFLISTSSRDFREGVVSRELPFGVVSRDFSFGVVSRYLSFGFGEESSLSFSLTKPLLSASELQNVSFVLLPKKVGPDNQNEAPNKMAHMLIYRDTQNPETYMYI